MLEPTDERNTNPVQELRARAEFLQKVGGAPMSRGHSLGTDALSALYRLSCSPEGVNDGLKLLHELQTHQIELDLLQEQNEANEREAAAALARYRMLYEFAPIAYVVLSADGHILECNRAGAGLLHAAHGDLEGALFENYLAPASRFVLGWYLKKLVNGSSSERCIVQSGNDTALQMFASLAPSGEILVFMQERLSRPGEA